MKPLSEETRHELTIAAATRERRNRPMALVAGAGALLVVAVIAAGVALADRARAAGELREDARSRERLEGRVEELKRLRAIEASEGPAPGESIPQLEIITRLEEAAAGAGLKDKPPLPKVITYDKEKIKIKEFMYQNVRSDNLKAMLEWARSASEAVPGLEVYKLELRAEPAAWSMMLTFRRWERAQ